MSSRGLPVVARGDPWLYAVARLLLVAPGAPSPCERGAAYLAAESGASVVPIRIAGAEDVLRGTWWRTLPSGWAAAAPSRLLLLRPCR